MIDWQKRFVPAPSKIMATLLIFGLLGSTGLAAKAEYRPDRTLYFVKKTIEKIELVLAMSSYQEAAIHLKHVQNRKDEVIKLAQSENLTKAEKEEYINTVVSKLKQDLSSASASLSIVNKADEESDKVADLAKQITIDSKDAVEVLNQVNEDIQLENVEQIIAEVIDSSENAEQDAIKILAVQQESGEIAEIEFTNEDLTALLDDKINRINKKIEVITISLNEIEVGLSNRRCERSGGTTICVREPLFDIEKQSLNDLFKKVSEAKKYMVSSSELLVEENFVDTLEKLKEGNNLVNQVNDKIIEITKEEVIEEEISEVKGVSEEKDIEVKKLDESTSEVIEIE